jgi:DcuC family C4-dicarboxylate transporter
MALVLNHARRIIVGLFAVIYLVSYFLEFPPLATIGTILLIMSVALAFPTLPATNTRVCAGLFIIGGLLLFIRGATIDMWLTALAKNSGLVTLFVAVPLISLPIYYDSYEAELKNVALRHLSGVWGFCLLVAVVTHLLGVVISIGAVPLVYELFKNNAKLYKAEKLFLAALLQGYMTTGFWSPAWASMPVVTNNLNLSWVSIIPWGIAFTVLSIGLSLLLIFLDIRQNPSRYQRLIPDPSVQVNWSKVLTLVSLISGFIGAIILVDLLTGWELMVIISLVALGFPLAAALILGKAPKLKSSLQKYYNVSLLKVKTEIVLFTAAGFLGKSLELSGVGKHIPALLPSWLHNFPLLTVLLLMTVMILISLPGIHPVVTGSALVGAINPLTLGLSPFIFGMTILTGWSLAIMLSPFSAISLIIGGLENIPSWNVSLKGNGFFGILPLLLMSAILAALSTIL